MKQIDEINRPRNEELFNNIHKQYQELAKIKTKDEQIEEMAKIAKQLLDKNRGWRCKCDICVANIIDGIYCDESAVINGLYNAGYRKQSEVAMEIFEELDNLLSKAVSVSSKGMAKAIQKQDGTGILVNESAVALLGVLKIAFAELKKKYTGGNNERN